MSFQHIVKSVGIGLLCIKISTSIYCINVPRPVEPIRPSINPSSPSTKPPTGEESDSGNNDASSSDESESGSNEGDGADF